MVLFGRFAGGCGRLYADLGGAVLCHQCDALYHSPGFDPVKEFVAIAPLSIVPNILVVNTASASFTCLIAARPKPVPISWADRST